MKIPSVEDQWKKVTASITKEEIYAFFTTLIVTTVLLLPMLTQRLNGSDGNLCGILYRSHNDYDIEDIAGRYLVKYVAHFKSLFVFHWLSIFVGIVSLLVGTLFLCRVLKIQTFRGKVAAVMFVEMAPAFLVTYTYGFVAGTYVFCFALTTFAVYLLHEKQTIGRMMVAILCMFVSLTFYQAYLFVTAVGFMFVLIRDLLKQEKSLRKIYCSFGMYVLSGIIAIVLYVVGNKVFKMVGLIYYQDSRYHYSDAFAPDVLFASLKHAYSYFFAYFFNMDIINNQWKQRALVNGIVFLLGIIFMVILYVRKKRSVATTATLVAAVLLLPWVFDAISILDYSETVRVMMLPTCALVYVGVIALWESVKRLKADEESDEHVPVRNITNALGWIYTVAIIYLLAIMVVYTGIYQIERKYYIDKTDTICQMIINRIGEEYPDRGSGKSVFIYGTADSGNLTTNYWIEQAGYITRGVEADVVFYEDINTQNAGWVKYIRDNFGIEYNYIGSERANEIIASEDFSQMAQFPDENSIMLTEDDIVVVKLSE